VPTSKRATPQTSTPVRRASAPRSLPPLSSQTASARLHWRGRWLDIGRGGEHLRPSPGEAVVAELLLGGTRGVARSPGTVRVSQEVRQPFRNSFGGEITADPPVDGVTHDFGH